MSIPSTNYRWQITALLFVATTINYLDRQVISLLKPTLERVFAWTETDYSHVVMAFQGAYALSFVAFGWGIDQIGAKIGYSLSVFVWSRVFACMPWQANTRLQHQPTRLPRSLVFLHYFTIVR